MKSYSAKIKEELTKLRIRRADDAKSLLSAFTLSIGTLKRIPGRKAWGVRCVSENEAAILFIAKLASKNYELEYEIKQVEHERLRALYNELLLYGSEIEKFMLETGIISRDSRGNMIFSSAVPREALETETQKKLFLRGLFLACGTMVSPEKAYHAEFVLKNSEIALCALEMLLKFGINAKLTKRKASFVIYVKDADALSDFMALIGASDAVLDITSIRIDKQAKNEANRGVNCIFANLDRALNTAKRQEEDIKLVIDNIGFANLPATLQTVAEARLNNMELSMAELAEMLGIGKSAVNYRLGKLSSMADEIRQSGCIKKIPETSGKAENTEKPGEPENTKKSDNPAKS